MTPMTGKSPSRGEGRRARKGPGTGVAATLCLVVASVLLAFLLCEAALRFLLPKYRWVAEGQVQADDLRVFAPVPNSRAWHVHPETGRRHPFHINNLGLRQHRDFSDADLVSTTTVGVFGDSFVQMPYLDAPYVFTEPLDYLLNLDGDFTVLNFGVEGYGPGQSYFTYRSFHAREALDYVLFVYFGGNDLRDFVRNGLFDVDDSGLLRRADAQGSLHARGSPSRSPAEGSAWWVPFASKLHLTYLALDATGRLAPYIAAATAQRRADWRGRINVPESRLHATAALFGQLIARWRREVEESGGKFFVALLPTQPAFPLVRPLLEAAGVGVIDLNACFAARDEGHRERDWLESPYYLRNDGHWNELANRRTAACLDDRLRREAGLPAVAEAAREAALADYYAAFESPQPGSARGTPSHVKSPQRGSARGTPRMWSPQPGSARGNPSHAKSPEGSRTGESIRRKYQALGRFEEADASLEAIIAPHKLAVDSDHYDVYVDGQRFVFVNDDCHAERGTAHLFAHATLIDASFQPSNTSYVPLHPRAVLHEDGRCIARWRAPPFSHMLVGQRDNTTRMLWSGEIFIDRARFEKRLETMLAAAGEPLIKSDMDVHVHGQRIFYVSDDCEGTDGRTPFFLHVTPVRATDLPQERLEHGYENLDFHQVGVTVGERCVVRWQLPDYPIRHIRTGQYVGVRDGKEVRDANIWEGEAAIGG